MSKVIGYTTGVFDLFHIGHLNVIKNAKENCDYLIVGVTTDEEVKRVKNKKTFIPFKERKEIINSLKYVDEVVEEDNTDKIIAWEKLKYDKLFKGSDWKRSKDFERYRKFFNNKNVEIVFFPYTIQTSSTQIREIINKNINNEL